MSCTGRTSGVESLLEATASIGHNVLQPYPTGDELLELDEQSINRIVSRFYVSGIVHNSDSKPHSRVVLEGFANALSILMRRGGIYQRR